MSTPSDPPRSDITHQAFKALPRDPSQPEHKKPRAFIHRPNEDPDEAAEARRNASLVDAAKTIQLDDFTKVHKTPCVRNALLPAIGGGMAIGAGRFVLGGSILAACNWASGCFVGVSLVAYNLCQRRRQLEKDGIRKAVQVLDKKQAMKDMQEKARTMGEAQAAGGVAGAQAPSSTTAVTTGGAVPFATSGDQHPQKQGANFWNTFKFW